MRLFSRFKSLTRHFLKQDKGYVAIAFAVLLLPILAIVGGAIDYRNIGREYATLRSAAEAAAVAVARAQFKPAQPGDPAPENPMTLMKAVFYANFPGGTSKYTYVTPTLTYVDPSEKAVTITATAGVKTVILQIIGFATYDISVEAKAGAFFSDKDVNIFFALDISPSMSAPADGTPSPKNAQGCSIFCHDDGSTIRAAGKTPKMDVIMSRLAASNGLFQVIADAAASNPVPINVTFYGMNFAHGLHASGMYPNVAVARANALAPYSLGPTGIQGGTDLKQSFQDLHSFVAGNAAPTKRNIIFIISDGMHERAPKPYDPAVCDALKADGDVFTFHVKNAATLYANPNIDDKVPNSTTIYARDRWPANIPYQNGGKIDSGYFSGLNNAGLLMKKCASKDEWAFTGELQADINSSLDAMAQAIIAPQIRVIN